ncbi:hypothetical protein SKAU_G00363820 [Synaphobranchus kaupii]|uniref:Uncharacterized protein n=1 Tax=Synaphobranchus kaupii TaxID=118154 RepID=A0A9Q1EIT4_SYNKA|nr:hypothetical protein SKAU_G00363820 [Synaphobranchus kaupii]
MDIQARDGHEDADGNGLDGGHRRVLRYVQRDVCRCGFSVPDDSSFRASVEGEGGRVDEQIQPYCRFPLSADIRLGGDRRHPSHPSTCWEPGTSPKTDPHRNCPLDDTKQLSVNSRPAPY